MIVMMMMMMMTNHGMMASTKQRTHDSSSPSWPFRVPRSSLAALQASPCPGSRPPASWAKELPPLRVDFVRSRSEGLGFRAGAEPCRWQGRIEALVVLQTCTAQLQLPKERQAQENH